jgi:hypothetical protein
MALLGEPNRWQPGHRLTQPKYFRREDAARHVRETWGLPCSPKWLAKLAVVGGGPIFRKAGKTPLYAPSDLDAWAQARIGAPRRSTSTLA